jgi:hypothetical protein
VNFFTLNLYHRPNGFENNIDDDEKHRIQREHPAGDHSSFTKISKVQHSILHNYNLQELSPMIQVFDRNYF